MEYRANLPTLLKKQPVQGEDLPDDQKKPVLEGTIYIVNEVLESDGLHSHVELASEAGSWWIFLPHWDVELQGQDLAAAFSLQQDNSSTLIYGYLTFNRGNQEILRVRATSGQPGFQYLGAHTVRGRGCIPPDNDWRISTSGYYSSTRGIEGIFYHITPDPDPDTGRSEFGLHRDSNVATSPGSAGCIVVKTSDFNNRIRPLLDSLRGVQLHVPLTVVYNQATAIAVASEGSGASYTVVPGDTLSGIASKQGVTLQNLLNENPGIINPDQIQVGDIIKVPGSGAGGSNTTDTAGSGTSVATSGESSVTYTVVPGDTLSRIATRHGVTVERVLSANPNITNPNLIHVGDMIKIPPAGGRESPASGESGGAGTNMETMALALGIWTEARDNPSASVRREEMIRVGGVILNRAQTGYRGKSTILDTVLDRFQFSHFNSLNNPERVALGSGSVQTVSNRMDGRPRWNEVLDIARHLLSGVIANPWSGMTTMRHYYSPRSMVPRGSAPSWVVLSNEVDVPNIPNNRFRWYRDIA